MRSRVFILSLLLVASAGWCAEKDPVLQQLLTRAAAARIEDQPALYTEAAQRELRSADQFYTSGNVDDAREAVKDLLTYSDKAHDASTKSGKKLKDTEIAMRKMAEKLRDIKRAVAFDEQGPLQAAADHLESLRTDLLSHMFGKGKK
ncbi:MAG: hypothetical protein WB421_09750 [Terriglobales bacterium]